LYPTLKVTFIYQQAHLYLRSGNYQIGGITVSYGRAMTQAVSRRPITTEATVRTWVSSCEICGGQSGTETGFPVNISMLIYHVGDEQYARWWPQFRDVVSPHRSEQQQQVLIRIIRWINYRY
jgi:hypothetical protein